MKDLLMDGIRIALIREPSHELQCQAKPGRDGQCPEAPAAIFLRKQLMPDIHPTQAYEDPFDSIHVHVPVRSNVCLIILKSLTCQTRYFGGILFQFCNKNVQGRHLQYVLFHNHLGFTSLPNQADLVGLSRQKKPCLW